MSTMMHSSKFEDDTAPLVSMEGVHFELTSLKQEQCSPTADLPLETYTSAPIHPLTQEMNLHSAGNSWESEHFKARRYSTGASQSYPRSHPPAHQSGTGDQHLHTMATSPPRHAHYERIPSARMIGRRHHLMLRRGEKGTNEGSSFTRASVAALTKGQKYQRMLDDGAPERKEEQEVDEEEEEDSSEKRREVVDRVSAFKKRRSWSGSLPSAFTFAPYQSF